MQHTFILSRHPVRKRLCLQICAFLDNGFRVDPGTVLGGNERGMVNKNGVGSGENVEQKPCMEKTGNTDNVDNNSLLQLDFNNSITCQPQARSTPLHKSLTSPPETAALLKNGKSLKQQVHSNGVKNGAALLQAVASTSSTSSAHHKKPKKLQSNPSINSQSSKRSKGSSKSNSSQIPTEAQDDCCVHCILACLFCEFLMLCNIVLDCATCGSCSSDESCFCCCCGSEECGDCELPCDMDCGIIDACCESADCLEICMECCGLCFSS
ncbi:MyoD family inhibitor [Bagarius yarrelli]|uniref:MyoD family inhibitor n=1 Tax=Bagarius yarrelli TaxID=175774 RepID=A0A556V405_BAGYA|nr:MyoD family inhibitor [Bagarius yarrelli]